MSGPAPRWLRPAARAASRVYGGVIERRNARYDARRGVVEFDRPVISVGNLTVGGTGKSPMVALVVQTLLDAGRTPAIAMRGYGARGGLSDEADAYVRRFPEVSLVAQPDRVEGLIRLFGLPEGEATDVVVLDDGFQHRRIARQLDIVLVDAAASPGVFEDDLLPAGWLREPASTLRRADAVVLSHADRVSASVREKLRRLCLEIKPGLILAEGRHAWTGVDVRDAGGAERREGLEWLAGQRVVTVCAIGQPRRFVEQVSASGAEVAGQVNLADHALYTAATLGGIVRLAKQARASVIVTTDKDWSKLRRVVGPLDLSWARPRLEMELADGGALLEAVRRVRVAEEAQGT